MLQVIRTNAEHPDFIELVKLLDLELAERDGTEHSFYAQFNTISSIKHVVLAYDHDKPLGCGAMKAYEPGTMEIKRMYMLPEARGKGIAAEILTALEVWAKELAITRCILETGHKQPEAIALYKKCGYQLIPNYGQYVAVENSVCFGKRFELEPM